MSKRPAAGDNWADKPKKINDLAKYIHTNRRQCEIDAIRLGILEKIIDTFDKKKGQLGEYDLMSFLLVKEQQVDVHRKLIERIDALDKLVGLSMSEMPIDTRIARLEHEMGVYLPPRRGYGANPNLWSSRLTVLEAYIERLMALELVIGIAVDGNIHERLQALYDEMVGDDERLLLPFYKEIGLKFPSTKYIERINVLERATWGKSTDRQTWRRQAKKRRQAQQEDVAEQKEKRQRIFEHRRGFFEEEDGVGGEYRSIVLWTIIDNILSSDSFAYFDDKKQKHNVFYKDDGSGRDTYIQAFMHWATKDATWSADAMSLCHLYDKRLSHQHTVRAVLSKFVYRHFDSDGQVYFTAFEKGKLIEFDYQRYYCTAPGVCRLLKDGEHIINGIDVDHYEQDKLQQIARDYGGLHINEVKNVLILLLIMEHELVHTMLAYLDRKDEWGKDRYISALNGYPPAYTEDGWDEKKKMDRHKARHDENHGVWFYYFIRNLFNHSGITSALENATCPDDSADKVVAETRDVLKDFIIKLRF